MKWETFTNRFRKDAHRQKEAVDLDALWESLEPEVDALNKEPRKRRFFFWFFFAGLLLAGTSWYLLSGSGSHYTEMTKTKTSQAPAQVEHPSTSNPKQDISTTIENLSATSAINQTKTQGSDNSTQSNEIDFNNNIQTNTAKPKIKRPTTTSLKNNLQAKDQIETSSLKTGKTPTSTIETSESDNSGILTIKPELVKTKSESTSKAMLSQADHSVLQNELATISSRSILLSQNNSWFSDSIFQLDSDLLSDEELAESAYRKKAKIKFIAQAHGGASFLQRTLREKDTPTELLAIRKKHETPLEAIHYGVSFGVEHQSGLRLSVGIQNTSINERYDFTETTVTERMIMGIVVYRVNPFGDTIAIEGLIPETTTTLNNIKIYNSYQLIDIPFSIGYHFPVGERWTVGVDAGLLANLSLKTKGIILDEGMQEVNLETAQDEVFKSKIGLNYSLGLSIGYAFSDQLQMSFAPVARFLPEDFTLDSYKLSQKYFLFGGELGCSYRF